MILPEAGDLLTPAMAIDGFRLGCLIDASTGMVLASMQREDAPAPATAPPTCRNRRRLTVALNGACER